MLNTAEKQFLNATCSFVIPFVLQTVLIVLLMAIPPYVFEYGKSVELVGRSSMFVSTAVGMMFLARALRMWAIPAGLLYVPVMFFILVGYTLSFVCVVYSDCL